MKGKISAIFIALTAAAVFAVDPPEYRLPKMRVAPVVDGIIDASEWRDAVGGFGFCAYPGDAAASVPVSFKIGRTEGRLYVAVSRPVGPAGVGVPAVERGRDWSVISDDNFEFVFVGDRTTSDPDFHHLIVNATGEKSSLAFVGGNHMPWAAKSVETKSVVTNGVWSFELSVSLGDIGFADKQPENHALRLCHTFRNIGTKYGFQASARPNEDGYFTAQRTIPIAFDDAAPAVELLEGRGDNSQWRVSMRLANPTKCKMSLSVKVMGRPSESQPGGVEAEVELEPGEEKTLPVSGPIIGDESIDVSSDVKDVFTGRRYAFREIWWRPNAPAPEWVATSDVDKKLQIKFAYYPSYDRIRIKADVSRLEKCPSTVEFAIFDVTGAMLSSTGIPVVGKGVASKIWDVPDLKARTMKSGDGLYRLVATVPGEGLAETNEFRRDVFSWEGYKGGLSDVLPRPFTPVERSVLENGDEKVTVILRDHVVDARTKLWKQVIAAGKPLLARPVSLVCDDDSALSDALFNAAWDCDGCCTWQMTLGPGKYGRISIDVPLRAERANLIHACAFGLRGNLAGEIPPGVGCVWKSGDFKSSFRYGDYIGQFRPYVWLGGPLRGVAVFGENDRGWVKDGEPCQEIVREADGTIVLRLNVVQKAVELGAPQTICIGFQATPTKPMEDGWRGIGIGTLLGSCKTWGAYQSYDAVRPYDGTDEFWRMMGDARRTGRPDKAYIARAVEDCVRLSGATGAGVEKIRQKYSSHFAIAMRESALRAKNTEKKLVFYTNARGVHLGSLEGRTFCDEWLRHEFSSRPYAFFDTDSYGLDPSSSFSDFAAYWYEKMLTSRACDYLYWDCIFLSPNYDLVGTDAYMTETGEIQPSAGLYNLRSLVRRGSVLQTELGLESRRNWLHMTNIALAPVLSFAGVNYDWEDRDGDKPLHERYPRASIQAATIGRQHGNQVAVMGYFATKDRESEKLKRLERCGAGLCLTHELQWTRVPAYREARRKLVECGYGASDAKVWNYWDEDEPFPVAIVGGETSALVLAHGSRTVVVVSDWSGGGDYMLTPNKNALGLAPEFRAHNLETGDECPVEDGAVKVTLGKYDYAMIAFE